MHSMIKKKKKCPALNFLENKFTKPPETIIKTQCICTNTHPMSSSTSWKLKPSMLWGFFASSINMDLFQQCYSVKMPRPISSRTPFTSKGKNADGNGCMCESTAALKSFQKMRKPDLLNIGERDCEFWRKGKQTTKGVHIQSSLLRFDPCPIEPAV